MKRSSSIPKVLAYIAGRPTDAISLDELAAEAGLSRFHFSRRFKSEVGLAPARYVERTRIEHAKCMIRRGRYALTTVAHEVGFCDQSHFAKRFRTHTGLTPAAYAAQCSGRLDRDRV